MHFVQDVLLTTPETLLSQPRSYAMSHVFFAVKSFLNAEEGATMVEYGLMLALISVICLTAISSVGNKTKLNFNQIAGSM
jgi:pilus assembly protein Flp/PilA